MIVVVGLAFEARIAAGPGYKSFAVGMGVISGARLTAAVREDCGGLVSFGVAGGLRPGPAARRLHRRVGYSLGHHPDADRPGMVAAT